MISLFYYRDGLVLVKNDFQDPSNIPKNQNKLNTDTICQHASQIAIMQYN